MPQKSLLIAALLACCCGSTASGQIVAVVDGRSITKEELDLELQSTIPALAGAAVSNATDQEKAAALDTLVSRAILTKAASERKLDQQRTYIAVKRRTDEALLVQALQEDVASRIPAPTASEVATFIAATPELFAQRKTYALDQIVFTVPQGNTTLLRSLEPLVTMDAVEQQLVNARARYTRAPATLDPATLNPQLMARIRELPPKEIFVLPDGSWLVANQITGSQFAPVSGAEATELATRLLHDKHVSDAADRELGERIANARKAVRYQPGYHAPSVADRVPAD